MTKALLALWPALLLASNAPAAVPANQFTPPKDRAIKVAFVLSEGALMIDFSGAWEVFQDTSIDLPTPAGSGSADPVEQQVFELYTVAPTRQPLHTSGGNPPRPGMTVVPDYSFTDVPDPDVIVVGGQTGGPGLTEWLQKMHAENKIIMSVCTGAFKLAKAGLLDGKPATTTHGALDLFKTQYPKINVVPNVRYVQSDPTTFTAGGSTSGINLALHVVALYYGQKTAQDVADYIEYQGKDW